MSLIPLSILNFTLAGTLIYILWIWKRGQKEAIAYIERSERLMDEEYKVGILIGYKLKMKYPDSSYDEILGMAQDIRELANAAARSETDE